MSWIGRFVVPVELAWVAVPAGVDADGAGVPALRPAGGVAAPMAGLDEDLVNLKAMKERTNV